MLWRIPLFFAVLLATTFFVASCRVAYDDDIEEGRVVLEIEEGGGEYFYDNEYLEDRGWDKLGERTVDYAYRSDHDTIFVTFLQGRFSRILLQVDGSDMELNDLVVTFGNGERFYPRIQHYFREGSRSRVIRLPGGERVIQKVEFFYRNLPGGGRAEVELWAR